MLGLAERGPKRQNAHWLTSTTRFSSCSWTHRHNERTVACGGSRTVVFWALLGGAGGVTLMSSPSVRGGSPCHWANDRKGRPS
jgi:hypothetical protein